MAASRPTCHNILEINPPSTLNFYLRPLANDLGCFPFDSGPSRSESVYPIIISIPFGVSLTSKEPTKHPPRSISALPGLNISNVLPK